MGAILDFNAVNPVLKQRYTRKKLNTLSYNENTLLALCPKDETLGGKNKVYGIRNAQPQTRSATFASGQSGAVPANSSSTYNSFVIPHFNHFAFAYISGDAIESAKGDESALIDVLTAEIDGAIYTATRSLAISMFRNGGGQRGQISAASAPGTPTITLTTLTDIVNFEVGMVLQTSVDDGTGGAGVKAGTVTLTKVDRDLGTLTASGNWTAGIATAAINDFIFQNGDYNGMLVGLGGWLPSSPPAANDAFFTVNRSNDATRLAGVRYNGNGGPIEETLIQAAARVCRERGNPDHVFLNPLDYSSLVVALGSKVIYDRVQSFDEPSIGFKAVMLDGPRGPIKVLMDVNCPRGTAYMLQLNTWVLDSIGKAPKIFELDGLNMLRQATADSYEVRCGYRADIACTAPGWNAVITL
jgi:hypothetical protein